MGRFVGTIAGSPSFELSELIAGHFRFKRFKQSLRQMHKAHKLLEDAGLEPHEVPMRTLLPLIEGGSNEDDEFLQHRWAALLASAAGTTFDVPPSFPQVLSQLEPVQARMLDAMYEVVVRTRLHHGGSGAAVPAVAFGASPAFRQSDDEFDYHSDCLVRLGVTERTAFSQDGALELTTFGRAFVGCCRPPREPDELRSESANDAIRTVFELDPEERF